MADPTDDLRALDARALRAIAHPLRLRMIALLRAEGPATASQLAERLGESSGLTSYHLRQLAAHDFIEEEVGRGTKRERWWRAKQRGMTMRASDLRDDPLPQTQEAVDVYLHEVVRHQFRSVEDWVRSRHEWPEEWRDVGVLNDYPLKLTPERLRDLVGELDAIIERYRSAPSAADDAERVVVVLDAFPQHTLPFGGPADADGA